jgi:hypothetical protein
MAAYVDYTAYKWKQYSLASRSFLHSSSEAQRPSFIPIEILYPIDSLGKNPQFSNLGSIFCVPSFWKTPRREFGMTASRFYITTAVGAAQPDIWICMI